MQTQDAVQLAGDCLGLIDNALQIAFLQDHAQERIDLIPAGRIVQRIVAFIQRTDIWKGAVVLHVTGGNCASVFVFFPTNAIPVAAAVGNHQHQRLAAELKAALQHFHDRAVWMFVDLIAKCEVRTRA